MTGRQGWGTVRAALGCVVVLLTVNAVSARAGVPCRLLVDAARDVAPPNLPPPSTAAYPDSLDVISADLASDRTTLTAVIRVVHLANWRTESPGGLHVAVSFTQDGYRYLMEAVRGQNDHSAIPEIAYREAFRLSVRPVDSMGDPYSESPSYHTLGLIPGLFDDDRSEIRVHAPMGLMLRARSPYLGGFVAWSHYAVDGVVVFTSYPADEGSSAGRYLLGSRNCVTVGK